MDRELIFDVGCHKGEDTDFYLKKGFRVVAVEANPALCREIRTRFRSNIEDGTLTLIENAISDQPGRVKFYVNELSIWGTTVESWAKRNEALGSPSTMIEVESIRFAALLQTFGVPYYMKVDIEGADMLCVEALASVADRPQHVSIEGEKSDWQALVAQFRLLHSLGYRRFKIVNQASVETQVPPSTPVHGRFVQHKFLPGSSGLFGEEAPGPWLDMEQAIAVYRRVFLGYRVAKLYGVMTSLPLARRMRGTVAAGRRAVRSFGGSTGVVLSTFGQSWHDIHASL